MGIKNIFNRDLVVDVSGVYAKRCIILDFEAGIGRTITSDVESHRVDVTYKNPKTNKFRTAIKKCNGHSHSSYDRAVVFRAKKLAQMIKNENKVQ